MRITMEGATHAGMVRPHNEDAVFYDRELGLCMVADGMGGQLAGEVASGMAIDMVAEMLTRLADKDQPPTVTDQDLSPVEGRLLAGIRLANQRIYESGQKNSAWRNMGTTIVAGLLDGPLLVVAHVGDSRCYLLRSGSICQLTDDHSLVAEQQRQGLLSREEAENSRLKNIITRALGAEVEVRIDSCVVDIMEGDRFLFCSDGLTNMVSDETILAIVAQEKDLPSACGMLIEKANQMGGKDNITVLLLAID